MGDSNDLRSEISAFLAQQQAAEPASVGDTLKGYSRAYLAGPTFGFNDEIEAAIVSPPLITDDYSKELASIQGEQADFAKRNPWTALATEVAGGAVLNPFGAVKDIFNTVKHGGQAAKVLLTNPIAQGAVAGAGHAKEGERSKDAFAGGLFGGALSGGASVLGSLFKTAAKEATKLKLSAFGITANDVNKSAQKVGGSTLEPKLVTAANDAAKRGVIVAGDDVTDNLTRVVGVQKQLGGTIGTVIDGLDGAVTRGTNFTTRNIDEYIGRISGTGRTKAEEAATQEYVALINQMRNGGSLRDLQNAKVGLNYKFDQNPYTEDVIKALRADLREEIENRVAAAEKAKKVPAGSLDALKKLNEKYGEYAELSDAFGRKVGKDYGGDILERIFMANATTTGQGSMNIATAASGNPLYWAAGTLANVSRGSEAKYQLGRNLEEVQKPLGVAGSVLLGEPIPGLNNVTIPAPITAQTSVPIVNAISGKSGEPPKQPKQSAQSEGDLLGEIQLLLQSQKKNGGTVSAETEDPLVEAIIRQESGGRADVVSDAGAVGLMQILPSTAKEIAAELGVEKYDLKDPATNRLFGSHYIKKLLQQFGGDAELALTAYHSGPGRVKNLLSRAQGSKLEDIKKYLGPVGQRYASGVLSKMRTA